MKNKLMRTTALVGSLMFVGSGISVAQTTVTGNLDLSFKNVQSKLYPTNSYQGFGKESQINIQTKGKLNNGLDYAAGFALEYDGDDNGKNGTSGWATENTYIDFISGGTTLTIGVDHIQNPDSHAFVNMSGVGYIGVQGAGVSNPGQTAGGADKFAMSIYPTNTLSQYQAPGIGIMQKTDVGTFSINYVPTSAWTAVDFGTGKSYAAGTSNLSFLGADIGNSNSVTLYEGTGEASYEFGFTGNLGVKGLNVMAFYNTSNETDANVGGAKYTGKVLGANYNFGQFSVGVDWRKQENAQSGTQNVVATGKAVGIAYAATPNFTLGAVYGKADLGGTASYISGYTDAEKIKIISAGYNLGPVVVNAQVRETKSLGGSASVNGEPKDAIVKVSTKF